MIIAVIVMNHYYRGFAQQGVEGKVFDSFPWIPPCKEREVVAHNCNIPHIGNSDCTRLRASTNDVIIDRGDQLGVLKCAHGCFRKNALRKYHDSSMANYG